MSAEHAKWCHEQAAFLGVCESPEVRRAKEGIFFDWCVYVLENRCGTGRKPHTAASPLRTIYEDLLDAWTIAIASMPILMHSRTFGQFVRWYEEHVMPSI